MKKEMKKTMRISVLLILAVIMTIFLAGGAAPAGAASAKRYRTSANVKKGGYVSVAACYRSLNAMRRAAGKRTLKKDVKLEEKARIRAREIVRRFSHTRPNGRDSLTMIPSWKAAGENLASGQNSCGEVMRDWYHSKTHRSNMLDGDFRRVGIAGYRCKGVIYWVQMYSS